jgi:hypothetical protein
LSVKNVSPYLHERSMAHRLYVSQHSTISFDVYNFLAHSFTNASRSRRAAEYAEITKSPPRGGIVNNG